MNVQHTYTAPAIDRSRGTHTQNRPESSGYRYGYAPTWAVLALARAGFSETARGFSETARGFSETGLSFSETGRGFSETGLSFQKNR